MSQISIDQGFTFYLSKKINKDFKYIGMTMRKFRNIINEHEADLRVYRLHTVLAR